MGKDRVGLYEILRGSIRVIASVPTRLVAIQEAAASNWDHREVTCYLRWGLWLRIQGSTGFHVIHEQRVPSVPIRSIGTGFVIRLRR